MRGRQSTLGLDEVDEPLAGPGKGETYFERTGKKKSYMYLREKAMSAGGKQCHLFLPSIDEFRWRFRIGWRWRRR